MSENIMIYSLLFGIPSLVAISIARIHYLAMRTPNLSSRAYYSAQDLSDDIIKVNQGTSYQDKMESLKKAQLFINDQMFDIRKNHPHLERDQLDWLRKAISLYLIGAADLIAKKGNCDIKGRQELINIILTTNLPLSEDIAVNYFESALDKGPECESAAMVQAGAQAANLWLEQQSVPEDITLRTQLNDWGILA